VERDKESEYAVKIIELAREELACSYPFLTPAIFALEAKEWAESGIKYGLGENAEAFLYEPKGLVDDFASGKDVGDVLLHSILHCLFLHPFIAPLHVNRQSWDLSCDICIRDIMNCLGKNKVVTDADMKGTALVSKLKKRVPVLSAEWAYGTLDGESVSADWFREDDHSFWYVPEESGGSREASGHGDDGRLLCNTNEEAESSDGNPVYDVGDEQLSLIECRRKWETIAGEIELSLQRQLQSAGGRGDYAGYFIEVLDSIERRNRDYSAFLKDFGAYEETARIDPDSFDIALYTYGLELYGDMPVIEPLEYSEQHTVREFAVAIDTSLSCSMETIRDFLEKTYDILFATMNYGERKKMVIFQCDSEIQNETVISDRDELKEYMTETLVHGRGGTDFRPVFLRLEELGKEKFFTCLRGLLYFTDGDGIYPEMPPKYKTAFVVPGYECFARIPDWVMKVRVN
jgi:hypothetical protein